MVLALAVLRQQVLIGLVGRGPGQELVAQLAVQHPDRLDELGPQGTAGGRGGGLLWGPRRRHLLARTARLGLACSVFENNRGQFTIPSYNSDALKCQSHSQSSSV